MKRNVINADCDWRSASSDRSPVRSPNGERLNEEDGALLPRLPNSGAGTKVARYTKNTDVMDNSRDCFE